jgi:hypothetical protein
MITVVVSPGARLAVTDDTFITYTANIVQPDDTSARSIVGFGAWPSTRAENNIK